MDVWVPLKSGGRVPGWVLPATDPLPVSNFRQLHHVHFSQWESNISNKNTATYYLYGEGTMLLGMMEIVVDENFLRLERLERVGYKDPSSYVITPPMAAMVAYKSMQMGFEGAFVIPTKRDFRLYRYYEKATGGFYLSTTNYVIIEEDVAKDLLHQYQRGGVQGE